MSKRENLLLVNDIMISLQRILEYTQHLDYDSFCNSQITIDAVIRNFEIAGEASIQASVEFKADNSQLNWRGLADFRNRLIHHYFGVNMEIVWDVIQNEIQEYLDFLATIEGLDTIHD